MAQVGGHICGVYYVVNHHRTYLPQVKLESHITINPVSFTTKLEQAFQTAGAASQVRYTFPLYDGVTVSGYTISFNEKVLTGVVKQKDDARKTYQAAVHRGETAGLLESLPAGVFGVTLGNIPAQTELLVNITYCGELKHDSAVDGLRYTLPTSIAPRYGAYPGTLLNSNAAATSMRLTVDVDIGDHSAIRKIQSPSHPIAVAMGELSNPSKQGVGAVSFCPSKASATLSQGSAELGEDFILQVVIDDLSRPRAVLEVHPTIPNQRAIMATLVPKFVLESANPEVVFIADQSGSMTGAKNEALVAALKVFLKSLPLGVRFNVCAFGNAFQFLWNSSQAYNEDNVNRAIEYVERFQAHLGGTELLKPIKAAFERRLKDMPLEVLVLTDGQIWQENEVFQYVNSEIESGIDARVFSLGIGQDVSHTLVEGLARAGNGFAQFVTQNEDTDQKVIRMLKGARYAHTKDYELEVTYSEGSQGDLHDNDDDFEMVAKLQDCLTVSTGEERVADPPKSRSFFDTSADLAQPVGPKERYAHLPPVSLPKLIQAPSKIPPLFPFNRSTIFILLDEHSSQQDIKSVTLRATSASGPLELEIPISRVTTAVSIHQLAARKAIQDLEEGRGWLHNAKIKADDQSETTIKVKYAGRFDEIVEREGVRLGEMFQVAGKWTSFVAVQDGQNKTNDEAAEQEPVEPVRGSLVGAARAGPGIYPQMAQMAQVPTVGFAGAQRAFPPPPPPPKSSAPFGFGSAMAATSSGLFGSTSGTAAGPPARHRRQLASASSSGQGVPRLYAARMAPCMAPASAAAGDGEQQEEREEEEEEEEEEDTDMGFGLIDDEGPQQKKKKNTSFSARTSAVRKEAPSGQGLHEIISLQTFCGAWKESGRLLELIRQTESVWEVFAYDRDITMTSLVVAYLEVKLGEKKDVWEMVVDKARAWLAAKIGGSEKANELIGMAKSRTVQER